MRKREARDEREEEMILLKNVSIPQNPSDELSQNDTEKISVERIIIPSKVQNLTCFQLFTCFEFEFSAREN